MATTAFSMPGPRAAAKASAMTRRGKARKMSVTRISTVSIMPPKYPATVPMTRPTGSTMIDTRKMMVSVMRLPWTMREKMSRPSSSVPNQCSWEGGSRRAVSVCPKGDWAVSQGARTAMTISASTTTRPATASGLRLSASQLPYQRPSRAWPRLRGASARSQSRHEPEVSAVIAPSGRPGNRRGRTRG